MRSTNPSRVDSILPRFQIPMRGNEESFDVVLNWTPEKKFQIPMRGNEIISRGFTRCRRGVSNPHEG